jgi:hypothetical protein
MSWATSQGSRWPGSLSDVRCKFEIADQRDLIASPFEQNHIPNGAWRVGGIAHQERGPAPLLHTLPGSTRECTRSRIGAPKHRVRHPQNGERTQT